MKTSTLTIMIEIAGVLHLGLICAGALMPRAVDLRAHIRTLPEFIRRLFWVYYTFIALCLVSFGALSIFGAPMLASHTPLARAVCLFLTAFWTLRFIASQFVFNLRPYLLNNYLKAGYHATNITFMYLPVVYALGAWKGLP